LHTATFGDRSSRSGLAAGAAIAWAGLLLTAVFANAPAAEERAAPVLEHIYTFSELLARADTVVSAEVGDTRDGRMALRVTEWLKGPPEEFKQARLQRKAEERLAQEVKAKDAPAAEAPPAVPLEVVVEDAIRPPKPGTQMLFFLWDQAAGAPAGVLRYRLSHPQCVYETNWTAEVKVELGRGRTAERRPYLREWDRQMAERLAQRQSDAAIRALEAGKAEKGLRLKLSSLRPTKLAPNGFNAFVRVENARDAAQAIYTGPLGGFGARLRPKDGPADKALVLRLTDPDVTRGVDAQVLSLVSSDDFEAVPRRDILLRDLHFEPREFPALSGLSGEYLVSIFYTNAQDGKGLEDLPGVPWTGTMASNEEPLAFEPIAARKKD
jgi:hypothetical protein